MSITNRASLTAYFQTGDIPSESNFVDLIESSATLSDENTFTLPISVNRTNSAGNANQLIIDGNGLEKSYDETASSAAGDNSGDVLTLRGSSSFLAPITGVGSSISIFGNLRSTASRLEKSKNIYFDADKHNFTGLNDLDNSELLTIDSGSTGYRKEINLSAAKISMLGRMSVTRPGLSSTDLNIRDTSSTAVSSVSSIFNINVNDLQAMTLSAGTVSTKIIASGNIEAPNGKVGIGTTNPNSNLTLSASKPILELQNSENNYSRILFNDSNRTNPGCIEFDTEYHCMSFSTQVGNTVMTLASTGNVGVGTTSPDKALTVVGDISASGQILAGGGFTGDIAGCTSITVVEGIITAAS